VRESFNGFDDHPRIPTIKLVPRTSPRELASAIGLLLERAARLGTSERVKLSELGLGHPERVDYEPSGWLSLRAALAPSEVGPDEVFADVGCGKGRVVYQAARMYPFKRVIGVELSPQLGEQARANVEARRARLRCKDVEIVTVDALDWDIPDDLTFVYMFRPFTGATFARLLERLIASYDRAPRRLRILYVHPEEHARVMATGRVGELRLRRGLIARLRRYPRDWARLYEITARDAATGAGASP
jgi:SAM-dependent methyltransferase